jgi:flagellar motility protein MotE (MotC chaperone)
MEAAIDAEDQALLDLKEQMTEEQCQEMADMLKAELERREREKSKGSLKMAKEKSSIKSSPLGGGLDANAMGEIYGDLEGQVRSLRMKKLEKKLEDAKRQQKRLGVKAKKKPFFSKRQAPVAASAASQDSEQVSAGVANAGLSAPSFRLPGQNVVIFGALIAIAALKIGLSTGTVQASTKDVEQDVTKAVAQDPQSRARLAGPSSVPSGLGAVKAVSAPRTFEDNTISAAEKHVLSLLDQRRVALEKRKVSLDRREQEIETQSGILAERLAELRALTEKLERVRGARDQRQLARLEQLASVYGSMAPKEAAPLVAKLDTSIALSLLERMPGKRMGQILSLMNQDRAIELTKMLTNSDID